MRIKITFGFLIVLFFFTAPLSGGQIQPGFRALLSQLPPRERVSAIAHLSERIDLEALEDSLAAARADRRSWHETVVRRLKWKALSTQAPVLAYLKTEMERGRVDGFKGFWISNSVVVECEPAVLFELEDRFDVENIYPDERLFLIEPVETGQAVTTSRGEIEPGIRAINAHLLWAQGVTGWGRLACNLDTGVDGNHVALASRWRGLDEGVSPDEAWFDPVTETDFPFDSRFHGTHTMGTMVGIDPVMGDSIGVAPEAKWIAAAVIDRIDIETTIEDALAALQWVADPDGDPETVDDVPDVANNSWGISPIFHDVQPCDETFWDAIDGAEAAGVVIIFGAGNEGERGPMTLRTPADRNTSDVNAFSVGALLEDQINIAPYSSRGPSSCDSLTFKPEVVAQGSYVRSAFVGGGYITLSGTSMACPHVSGAVLLLRQLAPDASSDEIKEALLLSAVDLGPAGEDNDYGMGRIDVLEAAKLLGNFSIVEGHLTDSETGEFLRGKVLVVDTPIEVESDKGGFYSLSLVGGHTYTLEANVFGYEPIEEEVILDEDTTYALDFPLERVPSGSLEGNVFDLSSQGIEDAYVSIQGTPLQTVVTDEQGYYRFDYLPADTYFVVGVKANGYEPFRKAVDIVEDETIRFDVELSDGFFDDFEGDYQGWSHYAVTPGYGDEWHNSESRNHTPTGSLSWKCGAWGEGSYGDYLDAALETPTVELDGNRELILWHWMDVEVYNEYLSWDGAIIEMRLNGGQWNLIEPVGGYQYQIHPYSEGPFPSGMPCIAGSHDWDYLRFDLRGIEGNARFRFRFGTDGSSAREGWYIDDVMLLDWRYIDGEAIVPMDSTVEVGDTLRFGAVAQNLTGEDRTFLGKVDILACGDYVYHALGPREFIILPYGRITLPNLKIPVLEWAPPMTLTCELTALAEDGGEIAKDSFVFTILPGHDKR